MPLTVRADPGKHDRDVIRFFTNHPRLALTPAGQRELWRILRRMSAQVRTLQSARSVERDWRWDAFQCIHRYEGAWNSNTGNGYYGGLQMDWSFMSAYGAEYLARWGTADHWPESVQITVAIRAHETRGFDPWPNTRRMCGL